MKVQLGDQRGRLEEQQLSQVHGAGPHHKQPYFAVNMGPKDININLTNRKPYVHLLQQRLPQTQVGANI